MASQLAFVQSAPAPQAPVWQLQVGAATQPTSATFHAPQDGPSWGSCTAVAATAAAAGRAMRGKGRAQKKQLRVVMQAATAAKPVALTGNTLKAALKMRCDTSGATYAIYWANVNGKLVVAGDYVTDARKAQLKADGFEKSFAEESESFALDASGDGPVASVYKSKESFFVKDIPASSLKRKDLAVKYGIKRICFTPFEAGVLEFGTADTWQEMPKCPLIPKADLRAGLENLGASYAMFWARPGDDFKVVADYVSDSRKEFLKVSRGDDKTFCSESRGVTLDANGDGPVATAFRTGEEVILTDTSVMKRAELAKEFGIAAVHFVPSSEGVMEFGIPANATLSGSVLEASMKMRCDTSGAGYALYWMQQDDKLVVSGSYTTPARKAALQEQGKEKSYADASKEFTLDPHGDGPIAQVIKTQKPWYTQDAPTCGTMKRSGLAAEYGVKSICIVPVTGGVLEYGTSDEASTEDWTCMEDARKAIMPKAELDTAFKNGATHVIFWWQQGEHFEVGASYVLPERVRALQAVRDDGKSYTSESSKVKIPVDSQGPVATAARSGKEIILDSSAEDQNFKRASLAKEFHIEKCHFVPCRDGVLEYGTGVNEN